MDCWLPSTAMEPYNIWSAHGLDVEGTRLSATTGLLELGTLGAHVRLLVLVGTHTKVPDSLAGVLGAAQKNRVAARRSAHSELVERKALAPSGLDARASRVSEAQGGNAELGQLKHTVVVRDRADDHHRLGGLRCLLGDTALVAREVDHARDRHRWTVDLGHKQAAQDHLVEARVSAAREEAVELHEQEQVWVLALGGLAVTLLDVVPLDVHSHPGKELVGKTIEETASPPGAIRCARHSPTPSRPCYQAKLYLCHVNMSAVVSRGWHVV